jgi:hypothetical protein
MRLRFKYKVTPALITAILVILYFILHWFFVFGDVIRNNDSEKAKKEKKKIEIVMPRA